MMPQERLDDQVQARKQSVIRRARTSRLVRPCHQSLAGVVCNRFYELILSTGCPFNCHYCYLQLAQGGAHGPVQFTNPWPEVERQLEQIPGGVFSSGEWADSLATHPPLLRPAIAYFRRQQDKFLFLTTKSADLSPLLDMEPTPQVWVSFSLNAVPAWERFEHRTPHPYERLAAAQTLQEAGWRVRVRLDPIIQEIGVEHYRDIAERLRRLGPERVTVGTLRKLPGLSHWPKGTPLEAHYTSPSGVKLYLPPVRADIYRRLADWLGFRPGLCRETHEVWQRLGWELTDCNCTAG
ncbi:MAG: radical SAM protein [Syntrophobacterales bacterium]|nr:radical SAM protein [Syntrophobacterales bacterium]